MSSPRSLRGRNIRSEKVSQRGQFFDLLRRIVGLRNEKDRKNGPLWRFRSRNISTAQTPKLTVACLCLLLAACGYQLQSYDRLPAEMQQTFLQAGNHYSPFYRQLRRALDDAGITLTSDPSQATATLVISKDDTGQRLVTISAQNQPLEFEVFYEISYLVKSKDGALLPLQAISVTRDYTYDQTIVLGKRQEEEILREELARDLVRRVLRSLDSIGKGSSKGASAFINNPG